MEATKEVTTQDIDNQLEQVTRNDNAPIGINVNDVIQLRSINGLSMSKIAKQLDCSKSTIAYYCREYQIPDKRALENYKNTRADVYAVNQMRYSENITREKLQKASARDLVMMKAIEYDKERLERGKSTQHTESIIHVYHELNDSIKEMRTQLEGSVDN
jgi:transcriptional regulator with XRE-family HTH domain